MSGWMTDWQIRDSISITNEEQQAGLLHEGAQRPAARRRGSQISRCLPPWQYGYFSTVISWILGMNVPK